MTSLRETFRNRRQIKELKLASNRVTDITGVFEYLKALRKLTLSDNLVSYVPDDNFNENTKLLEWNLIGSNIQWVGRNAFRGLVTLRDLRLRKNQLLSLNGSMRHLVNMKYFDAAFNEIQYLEKGEFKQNAFLAYISLMGNNISSVDGAFTGTVHLRGLGLAGNRIELLRRKDFPQRMIAAPNVTLDPVARRPRKSDSRFQTHHMRRKFERTCVGKGIYHLRGKPTLPPVFSSVHDVPAVRLRAPAWGS
ncbi:hypothetical protein V5799_002975 [Amblyomma americanum]|uniref:Uncharacterized protein n=1 Tax=Amblyomma americanum TaxID=6943 RepID=A0AAQ4DAA3_AMBAM